MNTIEFINTYSAMWIGICLGMAIAFLVAPMIKLRGWGGFVFFVFFLAASFGVHPLINALIVH